MVRKQIEVLEARRAALKVSELNFNSFFDYSFDRLEQICTENDIHDNQLLDLFDHAAAVLQGRRV